MIGDYGYPLVQAKNYRVANRQPGDVQWVVIHDMETSERLAAAEDVANYFRTTTRKASVHFNCDANSTVQSVLLKDIAYGAGGANPTGIHIEQAGYARQTVEQWADPYSQAMILGQVAPLVAKLCVDWQIPVRFVDVAGLKRGDKGLTTHAECAKAFGGDHWDPGPNYPIGQLVEAVLRIIDPPMPRPIPGNITKGNQMHLQRDGKLWAFWSSADGRLMHNYFDGTRWMGRRVISGGVVPSGQVEAFWLSDQWHVQCAAAGPEGGCVHAWWNGSAIGLETI